MISSEQGIAPVCRYDAYVSYAEADREWVEETLAPRLRQAGRSLYLEHDLPPGGVEVEERSRAVAASRKTLMVLSPDYLQHRWALFEGAVSHQLDPAARKRRLIPVLRSPCDTPLRIRPLVAVDLRRDDQPAPWQRLLTALDPSREEPSLSLGQRWSLRISAATAELAHPHWHAAGAAWLLAAYLALAAVVALAHLLLREAASLRDAITFLLAVPSHALAALVWREDHDLFRRLSHVLGGSRSLQGSVALLAVAIAASWWSAGAPAARELICGRWGCQQEGTIRLTMAEFTASPAGLPAAADLASRLRSTTEQKLSAAADAGIQVLSQDLPQIDAAARRQLNVDYTIRAELRSSPQAGVIATASLFDRHFRLAPPAVTVKSSYFDEDDEQGWLELQNRFALALVDRLGVVLPARTAALVAATPTASPSALKLNEEGFDLQRQERYTEAEETLRAALDLDPDYAAAWSNLGEVAFRQGRYTEALEHRRRAAQLLPSYAPVHFNLGHLLAFLGQDTEALEALQRAITIDPAHVPSYNELGNVLLALNRAEEAVEPLRQGLRLAPDSAPLAKNLGRALLATDDTANAIAALEQALTLYPQADWLGLTEAHALLVQASHRHGDTAAACQHLDQLRQLDPASIAPWWPDLALATKDLPCIST